MANAEQVRPGSMAGLARTHGVSRVTLYLIEKELVAENRESRKKAKGGQS
jgi:DNA-binding XRE family transcriptional regulator